MRTREQIECVCNIGNQVREFATTANVTPGEFLASVAAYMQTASSVRMVAALIRHGAVSHDMTPDAMLGDVCRNVEILEEATKAINDHE